jgi:hypothetical protein
MIELVDYGFGPGARSRADEARLPGREGALAALETFYYALTARIWRRWSPGGPTPSWCS